MRRKLLFLLALVSLLLGMLSVHAAAETATPVRQWNMVLGDDIRANFYLEAPANGSVKVTVGERTQIYDLSGQAPNAQGLYKVSVPVAAAQMTENITLQLLVEGASYGPVSYSIRDYAQQILTGNYSQEAKNLVRHMLHYGAAAQIYFGVNTDQLANAGYPLDGTAQYPTESPAPVVSGKIDGVAFYGASLVMENKVALRFYFTAESLEGVSFSPYTTNQKDGMFYVEVPGIGPDQYHRSVTVRAVKGQEKLEITYSPLTYLARMHQKGGKNMQALVDAMYGYHLAALEYGNSPIFDVVKGNWDLSDAHKGSLTIPLKTQGTTVITKAAGYRGISLKVKEHTPSNNADGSLKTGDFSVQLSFIFDDGKQYQVRIHNTDADGNYKLQHMGEANSLTGWKWQADLTAAQKQKLIYGDGVEFSVQLVGANAQLWVDGQLMVTYGLPAAYDGKMAQIKLCINGNLGVQDLRIPYKLTKAANAVTVSVPAFANGAVQADKNVYQLGETVTLTVSPDAGYSQKLYLNGQALLLDWKTNTYSFVATEETYVLSGSFVPSLNMEPKDAARWDTANQAHGILNTYYPSHTDSWLMYIREECSAVTVKAKNDLAGPDGTGGAGFATNLGVKLSNGKEYVFRIVYENGKYYHQRFAINGSDWKKTELSAQDRAAVCGEGAEFKLERTAANTLTLLVNGRVYDTYTMDGVTEDVWVSHVILGHYGLKGQKVAIPFALTKAPETEHIAFRSADLSRYVIVYEGGNADYLGYANQLKNRIAETYGVTLPVVSDQYSSQSQYEILLGDTNRDDRTGRVMEYSVTVDQGLFRINVGGSCSAENAVNYLCEKVFNGQTVSLTKGEHYRNTLLTNSHALTSGTTARVMSANILADAFSDDNFKTANYRVEILAGALVSYTPDVIGLQEVDNSWNRVLDSYLTKIEKTHGIRYARHWATYEGKTNYTSLLYRADKFQVSAGGVEVFSWWKDLGANYRYHMRNISWAQFTSLENPNKKFVVANTHWSYRTEHADGNTYLTGATKPIANDELRTQCKTETNKFMTTLKNTYSGCPVFLVGDFNTSLPYFTSYGWTPSSYNVISQQAKNNGTALSTVPTSGHFDHLFGAGSYTIKCYAFFKDTNQHSLLTDHPFVYADLAF